MPWLIFGTLAVWLYLVLKIAVFLSTSRRRRVQDRLEEFVIQTPKSHRSLSQNHLWRQVVAVLEQRVMAKLPQHRLDKLELRLLRAGSPNGLTVTSWTALRLVSVLSGLVFGVASLLVLGVQPVHFALPLVLVLFGWLVPDLWLSKQITRRQTTLRRQFPGMLDLLTVSVEAGLGFDQAMGKVAEESSPPMADEVQRLLREMQLGSARIDALQRFAYRTGVDVIELFVAAVIQAERLGVGLTTVLRVQADEARNKQRMEAHEKATKAPTKILFPLVVFIFPALFVVVLGPAALHIMQTFGNK